jgi:hypothetical protein
VKQSDDKQPLCLFIEFAYLCHTYLNNSIMTQLVFKNDIDQSKIDVLLSMVKSWNIETSVVTAAPRKNKCKKNTALTLSVGLWAGRDIDDKQLRDRAWGTSKRAHK